MHSACTIGSLEIVRLLLHQRARINCVNSNHQTPLLVASAYNHGRIIEFLLKRNARYLRHFCLPHKKNLSCFLGTITSFLILGTQASNKLHAMAQERFRLNFAFLTHLPSIMFPGSRTKTRTTSRLCYWLLPRAMLRRSASCWQQELTSSLRTRRIEQHSFGHRRKITEKSSR